MPGQGRRSAAGEEQEREAIGQEAARDRRWL